MADKKKSKSRRTTIERSKEWMEEEGLSPVTVIDKKTGKPQPSKTFDLTRKSVKSKSEKELGPEFRKYYIALMKRGGLDMSEEEYLDRVAKAEKKARMKKATGPELTTPRKKPKGAMGMLVGPAYRHGHKDLRKSGLSNRIK